MRRLSKVRITWTPNFAYAIGLIATDGSLSKDGRHINFTSKDLVLVESFRECLGLNNKIGRKTREKEQEKKYFQIQFGDKNFYEFLLSLGLTPAKSKTLGTLNIPSSCFADFLRGCIDGDGNIGIHRHPESQHLQLRVNLTSASKIFLEWMKERIKIEINIAGGWIYTYGNMHVLSYGKSDSIKLLKFMYYPNVEFYLARKYLRAEPFLRVWPNW